MNKTSFSLLTLLSLSLTTGCAWLNPPAPLKVQTPARVLGLVEFTLEDNGTQIQSRARWIELNSQTATVPTTHLPVISKAGSTNTSDLGGQRYLSAGFEVQNPADGSAYANLSFHAVSIDDSLGGGASLGGTALRNLKDGSNALITDAAVARSLSPTHKLVNLGGAMQVDPTGADFQVFDAASEVSPVQAAINALPGLNGHVQALGYGFVARQGLNTPARAIGPGQTGYVTLGFHLPLAANPASTPRSMSLIYAVVDQSVSRVTEAFEEQGTTSSESRAQALGSGTGINVLPGSRLGTARLICPVVWAVASGPLPALRTECPSLPNATLSVGTPTPIVVWHGSGTSVRLSASGPNLGAARWSSPLASLNPMAKTTASLSGSGSSVTATLPAPGVYHVRVSVPNGSATLTADTWLQAWDPNGARSTPLGTGPAVTPPQTVRELSPVPAPFAHPRLFFNASDWPEQHVRALSGQVAGWGYRTLQTQMANTVDSPGSAIGALVSFFDAGGVGATPSLTPMTQDSVLASEATNSFWGMLLAASARFWLDHDPSVDPSTWSSADRDRAARLSRVLANASDYVVKANFDGVSSVIGQTGPLAIKDLAKNGEPIVGAGLSEVAVAYDLLYPWMTDAQRTPVRNLLYAASWGRHQANAGFNNDGSVRLGASMNGDFSNLNDHTLLAAMAIEGEESKVDRAVVSTFGSAVGTPASWMKALPDTNLNGWPGATQAAVDGLQREIHWMVDWFTTPWGLASNHLAYLGFSAKQMFPTALAYARRSENVFVTTNLYQIALHELQVLHPAEAPIVSRIGLGSTTLGWWDHHDSGSFGQRGTAPILLKYMYPDDPLIDYVYRAYLPTLDRDPLIAALFGLDPSIGVAEQSLPDVAARKGLPNTLYDPQRGIITLRSGWSEKDLSVWFESNGSDAHAGHMHAERNSFDLFALGRAWSVAPGYHVTINDAQASVLIKDSRYTDDPATGGYIGESPSSATNRAGFPGHFPTPPGQILEVAEDPQGAWSLVAGDATVAYSYGYEHGVNTPLDIGKKLSDFLVPGMLDLFTQRNPAFSGYFAAPLKVTAAYNPVQYAIRTLLVVRGARPYVLVVDDINKDRHKHDWQWTMNSAQGFGAGGDTRFIDASGRGAYSSTAIKPGATPSDALLWHSPIDDGFGKPRLLVRDLGMNALSGQPDIKLESKPPNKVGMDYLTYGVDNNHPQDGAVKVPTNRLLIERRDVISPDYTVLLFPHQDGEALPLTSWSSDRKTLTLDFGNGVVHTIGFDRTNPDHRTRLQVSMR